MKSQLLISLSTAAAVAAAQTCLLSEAPSNNGTLIYSNALDSPASLDGWVAEGPVASAFPNATLELSSSTADGNFVYWLPDVFPARIRVTWDFSPRNEPGLAMFFFGAAAAVDGVGSIFDPGLAPRNGSYAQYHSGDIRTLHASYFRRKLLDERAFHVANLRKSPGFHLVAQGADPLPPVVDAAGAWYRVEVVKDATDVYFSINDLPVYSWRDEDNSTGPLIGAGRIGLRQLAPLVARYRNLQVFEL